MEQLLTDYIRDNIDLSKRFAHAPHGKATCKMLLDQSYGALDFITNVLEYDEHYSKEQVQEIYKTWEKKWFPLLQNYVNIASE
jgi:hypothetical protein